MPMTPKIPPRIIQDAKSFGSTAGGGKGNNVEAYMNGMQAQRAAGRWMPSKKAKASVKSKSKK
jgi:hypothetical protein